MVIEIMENIYYDLKNDLMVDIRKDKPSIKKPNFNHKGYRVVSIDGKNHALHRLIYQATNKGDDITGFLIDHKDRNINNNHPSNLRKVTHQQNSWNKKALGKINYKGVSWHKKSKRYQVRIWKNGKREMVGYFKDPKKAALAYDRAALEVHGEYAATNKSLGLL